MSERPINWAGINAHLERVLGCPSGLRGLGPRRRLPGGGRSLPLQLPPDPDYPVKQLRRNLTLKQRQYLGVGRKLEEVVKRALRQRDHVRETYRIFKQVEPRFTCPDVLDELESSLLTSWRLIQEARAIDGLLKD